jgi:predicted RNA-binding Zn-ribbon protein involved in translation (DUF1610 family)
MPKHSNTWYVTDETKFALHDMKRVVERRMDLRSKLTQDQFMVLIATNHKDIIDCIVRSELTIKDPYGFEEAGIVYTCPQCGEKTFVRRFKSLLFVCSSCGHQYQHSNSISEDDYLDDLTNGSREKTRLDIIEEIGLQLQKRFPKKKR